MAQTPSVSTVTNSAEAFAFPLPAARQFHKQLHNALDDKNARLRTLVGGSYRQLLGTAEMIVEMRRDIEITEGKLGRVAEGCGRNVVGKRVTGLERMGTGIGNEGQLGRIARLKVLSGCIIVAGRLLRGKETRQDGSRTQGDRLVRAAKVLVLSRLLVKSVSDEMEKDGNIAQTSLPEIKSKLTSLRRRLDRGVEKVLEDADGEREALGQALCAYSLATNSGAKDVLRHFLHIRGGAMALSFEEETHSSAHNPKHDAVMQALKLYTRTLLDVQVLVPRRLSDLLVGLKGEPLLEDHALRDLEGLRLDVCDRWFGEEVLNFVPYIRHDDLDASQAVSTLKGWAKQASEVLLQGFRKTLVRTSNFKAVIKLRTDVFKTWIDEGGKAKGFDPSVMLDGLRQIVNERLGDILDETVAKLHLVGTEVEGALGSWATTTSDRSPRLWTDDLYGMELDNGASAFKKSIISGVHGQSNAVLRVVKGYGIWRHLVDEMDDNIEQVKRDRWDDDIESLEDDQSLEARNTLLSKDDPEMLHGRLDSSLATAFKALHQKLAVLLSTYTQSDHVGSMAIFLLRIIRDIRGELPKRPDLRSFGLFLTPSLHEVLASKVSTKSMLAFASSLTDRRRVMGRALWEGSPELPVYPSTATFRLLHSLSSSMADAGNDLWSATAIEILKSHLLMVVSSDVDQALDTFDQMKAPLENLQPRNSTSATQVNAKGEVTDSPSEADDANEELSAPALNNTRSANGDLNGVRQAEGEINVNLNEPDVGVQGLKSSVWPTSDLYIQLLFDTIVLTCFLSQSPGSEPGKMGKVQERLKAKLELELTTTDYEKMEKAARDYWKRTNLLFGVLAQ